MKIVLSAYACGPDVGSEPEVGLRVLEAALTRHEVWVLTQPRFVPSLRAHLDAGGHRERAHVLAVEPDVPGDSTGLGGLARSQWSHDAWQREAARVIARLDEQVRPDLVHHATLAAYWMRAGASSSRAPMVWGPVGGGVETPWALWPALGARGVLEDAVRLVVRRALARTAAVRAAPERAAVLLLQNDETRQRVGPRPGLVRLLPNALCAVAGLVGPAAGSARRRDVVVVGRAVPWKAVPLAARVLAQLPPDVALRVLGAASPAETRRIRAAALRHGVEDRLTLVGRRPRPEVLQDVATAGVLLHPALHDESPGAVAEALALGTPVVALRHGGPAALAPEWPQTPSRLVLPARPGPLTRRLAAACEELLASPPPVRARPVAPLTDFTVALLQAYDDAVAAAG